jgi:hypothetical protein
MQSQRPAAGIADVQLHVVSLLPRECHDNARTSRNGDCEMLS